MKRFAAACLLLFNAGCSGPTQNTPPPSSEQMQTMPLGVSEEAFIALHQHTEDKAPKPKGEMIQIGPDRAYLSLPSKKSAPFPTVFLIHEWWGLNDHIKHWADRLAAEGYAAVALDLYQGRSTKDPGEAMSLYKSVDETKALRTLSNAYEFVAQDPRIRATKRASIGWCFGGGWSLKYAIAHPLDASVIYYGQLINDPVMLQQIKGKLLGVFGNLDQGIPKGQVDIFEKALKQAKVDHRLLRYDANHAFANPSSGRYDQTSATEAWKNVREFLARELKSTP